MILIFFSGARYHVRHSGCAVLLRDAMLALHVLWPCVCVLQVGVLSKGLNGLTFSIEATLGLSFTVFYGNSDIFNEKITFLYKVV